jgi:hypothetical protein
MTIARNRTSVVALAQVQIIELDFRDEKVSRLGAGPLSSGMDRQKKRSGSPGPDACFPKQAGSP